MQKILIALLILAALIGGAFFYWSGTPQYSFLQLTEAVKKHDGELFREYFDLDQVSRAAVDDMLSQQVKEIGGEGLLQKFVGHTLAGIFKPELSQILARNIMQYVETKPKRSNVAKHSAERSKSPNQESRSVQDMSQSEPAPKPPAGPVKRAVGNFVSMLVETIRPPSLKDTLKELGLSKETFRGFTDFKTDGSLCHVGLRFQAPGKNQVIVELELEKIENRWVVIRFSNLPALAKAVI